MAAMAHRPRPLLSLMFALCIAAPVGPVDATGQDPVTIYRCTGSDGRLALRNTPCKRGEQQQAIEMQRPKDPPPRPAPDPAPAPPQLPAPAQVVTRVVLVERPDPVYECTTAEGDAYLSDNPAGNPRWVPLWTLGYPARPPYAYPRRPVDLPARPAASDDYLGNDLVFDGIGRPTPAPPADARRAPELPPAVGLAYTQGRWIRDSCERLPPAEVCQRLRDRHWELGRQYNSALQSERRQIDAEQRRISARVDSECAG